MLNQLVQLIYNKVQEELSICNWYIVSNDNWYNWHRKNFQFESSILCNLKLLGNSQTQSGRWGDVTKFLDSIVEHNKFF
jgi:hypothetical protein